MNSKRKDIVYDLETYPNIFTCCIVFADKPNSKPRVYEISDRKNDTEELVEFFRNVVRNNYRMVGFNNLGFDYVIVHYIIEKARKCLRQQKKLSLTAKELYGVAQEIIDSMKGNDRFGKSVKESDIVIPQVDLFKIWHFDNKAKATSLKTLEFNMRSDNIEDLPFPVGKILTDDEKNILIEYNKHDVLETLKFYRYSDEALSLREELTQLYGFDCTNFNDTKIGKELFIRSIEKESPGSCYIQTERGRKINQTKRDKIVIKDCLFKYIQFNRPEFKAIHEWFKRQTITETKGVFSDLLEHELGDVAKYARMVVKKKKISDPVDKKNKKYVPTEEHLSKLRKEQPMGWVEEKELKSPKGAKSYYWCYNVAETLNVVINGFRFDYGVGGIHGAKRGIIKAPKGYKFATYDVASYYPNMAIANNVYPEHLGLTFCKVYKDLYEQRKSQPKGSAANSALKLALNGVYGDSGNEFSPLYDPKYTMTITIGGQLTLCMLIEEVIDKCNAEIIMCNTDGFEFIYPEEFEDEVKRLVSEWEKKTGLQMEGDQYETMWIRDVNNYISKTTSGKLKLKGAFEYADFKKLGWHKNHSAMVIAKAAEAYFVRGEDYEEFIQLHDDKYDFLLRTKVPRSSELILVTEEGHEIKQQNNCRYYPSKNGGKLIKLMPALEEGGELRRLGIDTDWSVKTCNDIADFDWNDLNREYFISEVRKLVDSVEGTEDPSPLSTSSDSSESGVE